MLIENSQNNQAPTRAFSHRLPSSQRAMEPQQEPATASQFRDKLREMGEKGKERANQSLKQRKPGTEEPGHAEEGSHMPFPKAGIAEKEGGIAEVGSIHATAERGVTAAEPSPTTSSIDVATTELAAKFAERLALAPVGTADTQVFLDPGRFTVSEVTITGRGEEGLAFAYDGEGKGDRDGRPDEEALRLRLEARGIKVTSIARRD